MRDVVSSSVIPMLLGDNNNSRRLARRLFWYFNLRSYIFDKKCSLRLGLMLSAAFCQLPGGRSDEFIIMTLERFTGENDDMTFLLVTCSPEAERFIERNGGALEEKFLIRTYAETVASLKQDERSPYCPIYQKKGYKK